MEPGANPDSHGCLYIGQPWLPLIITLFERLLAFMKGSNKSWAMDITNEHVKNVQISTNLISLKSLNNERFFGCPEQLHRRPCQSASAVSDSISQ